MCGAEGYTEHKTKLDDLFYIRMYDMTPVKGNVIPQQYDKSSSSTAVDQHVGTAPCTTVPGIYTK